MQGTGPEKGRVLAQEMGPVRERGSGMGSELAQDSAPELGRAPPW